MESSANPPPPPGGKPAAALAPEAPQQTVVVNLPSEAVRRRLDKDPTIDGMPSADDAATKEPIWDVSDDVPAYGSKKMFVSMLLAMLFVWCYGWLYISAAWNPQARTKHLKVAVLNCDRGVPASAQQQVPPALAPAAARLAAQPLGLGVLSASIWNTSSSVSRILNWRNYSCPAPAGGGRGCAPASEAACLAHLRDAVLQGRAFAGIYIDGNLSATFLATAFGTNTSAQLSPPTRVTYFRATGRQLSTYSYITSIVNAWASQASYSLGAYLLSDPSAAAAVNRYWLLRPLQLVSVDLAPVTHFGQFFSTFMLVLLTWMGSAFAVAVAFDFHMPAEARMLQGGPPLTRKQALQAVAIRTMVALTTTLVGCSLLISIPAILGHAQFVGANAGHAIAFLWFSSWAYMGIHAVLLHALGPAKFSIFSTLLLILQLSSATAVVAHELSPGFYRIGYALPFFWVVRGLRTIFFGVMKDSMYISWLVIAAWNAVAWCASASLLFARERGRLGGWKGVKDAALVLQGAHHHQAVTAPPLVA